MRSRRAAQSFWNTRHTYRLDLILDFESPAEAARAREVARRILDALRIEATQTGDTGSLESARLMCPDLQRLFSLYPPTTSAVRDSSEAGEP